MSSQPVEANVVLTADNSGYDQAMTASAGTTQQLMTSVDSLTAKVSKMTKTAGKSLIGITAADTALIGGATKAWNDYEKQMERLRSQAAVLSRTNDQQNKVMKDYTNTVKTLRSEFGTTTTEAAKLVETLSKVTSIKQTRDLKDLSKVFIEMSGATGESSEGLASSLTNLQKVMGEPINVKTTKQYADTFTYLAAQTNTSAQGLMDFTAQLAPVAKSLGMNTKEVAGFATAFTKAGVEGGTAATAFTKVTGDMLKSLQSGSPELAHYANMVGVTQGAFRKLAKDDSAEAVVEVFESLSRNSKTATAELNRLGLDGPRTLRAITSMTNQPGGLRAALGIAQDPAAKGASHRGYDATMRGLSDEFDKLQEDLKQTAEAFATYLGPALEMFLKGMEKAASIMQTITEGPMGKFLQMVAGFLAPLAGAAGLLLLFAGALVKVASAFTLLRSSAAYGVREGFTGKGSALTKTGVDAAGRSIFGPMGGGPMGTRGEQLAEKGTWIQRGMYNTGMFAGQGLGAFKRGGAVPESWYQTREALSSKIPWTEQYARPTEGTMRTPLSYVAGGLGRGIDNFVTPTFDQMRYADPTKRSQWASREAPWASMGQRMGLVKSMGQVGLAESQLAAQRSETVKVAQDPLMTSEAREARLGELRTMREETRTRLAGYRAQETANREVIASQQLATRANEESAVGGKKLGESLRALGANVGGGIMGGARAGMGAFYRSGMMGPTAAMGTMAGASMLGIDSGTLMGAATGAMIGSVVPGVGTAIGAGVGGAIGLATDMAKANNDVTESIKNLNTSATEAGKTGSGFSQLQDQSVQSAKDMDEWSKSIGASGNQLSYWFGAPKMSMFKEAPGAVKNVFEGVFGTSDATEAQNKLDTTTKKVRDTEGAVRDLAKASGIKLTGTSDNQLKQLDAFMSDKGMSQLGAAGIDLDKLIAAKAKGGTAYTDMITAASLPGQASGMWDRLRTTESGQAMLSSPTARKAIQKEGDIALQYDAVNEVFDNMRASGMSLLDIVKSTEKAEAKIGVEGGPEYSQQAAYGQRAQYALAMQAPQLGRMGAFQQQMDLTKTMLSVKPKTETDAAERETQKQAAAQAIADNDAYFRQLLLAQQSYERNRIRAQQDYSLQRQYQEYDYDLQRTRAEENFDKMRGRAVADYHRSVTRAWSDFNLQRKRQEEDYHHQVDVMVRQQGESMMNIYERVDTQRTASATWTIANAQDQINRMKEQEKNLDTLRGRGLSKNAIQQLKLTDPANAQQLARDVAEFTPKVVREMNRVAGSERLKATKTLVTDASNETWAEMQRSFRISRNRGLDDMNRSMDRQRRDFRRGLHQQRDDFNLMMDQQAEDYRTQVGRQEDAYRRSMHRSAEDMAHMADEITGSVESVLVRAHKKLTGSAKEQAGIALQSFKDLNTDTSAEAVALMTNLAAVFGFKYTPPAGAATGSAGAAGTNATVAEHNMNTSPMSSSPVSRYDGGVIPGYTPGRDTHQVYVGGGEAVMRPEWVRLVGGEKAVDAMNHAAKHGGVERGYAQGGVVNPDSRVYMDGEPLSKISAAQVLLAEKLSRLNFSIMQGSWQPYTSYSGSSHMGPGVLDAAPGNFTTQYWLRRVGFAAWGRNFPGAATAGSGAHVHSVSRLDPGARGQSQLSSFARGEDGLGGKDYGPNPPLEPGLMQMLAQFGDLAVSSGSGATGGGMALSPRQARRMVADQLLKDIYAKAEHSAAKMSGVHPLQPGMISKIINRYARQKIRQMVHKYGAPGGGGAGAPAANISGDVASAQSFARSSLDDYGWGQNQFAPLRNLWNRESGWRWNAKNPSSGAYGIPQSLPGTKMASAGQDWQTNAATQIRWGMGYIKGRYGTPAAAWAHSNATNWYGDGAMFDQPNVIGVGERGPEAVIPLNDRGGEFLARSIGLSTMAGTGGHTSIHNYRIDRSTNFTGPITVAANDPNEMLAKLTARQRVRALSRPSLTGSAA